MKVILTPPTCQVIREDGDPVFRGNHNAAGESRLLYHVKHYLNGCGHDFIKKRMWKDGHLVDDMQQYLRERKPVAGSQYCIFNPRWQIRGADSIFRERGEVILRVVDLLNAESAI